MIGHQYNRSESLLRGHYNTELHLPNVIKKKTSSNKQERQCLKVGTENVIKPNQANDVLKLDKYFVLNNLVLLIIECIIISNP